MLREVLQSKIHKATITEADLNYVGSITIDVDLLEKNRPMAWPKSNCGIEHFWKSS